MIRALPALLLMMLAALPGWAMGDGGTQCVKAGCSGQLCVDASMGRIVTTCEWKEAYGCLKEHGACEAQANGECGWTQSEALKSCLNEHQEQEAEAKRKRSCTHVCGDICVNARFALTARFDCTPRPEDSCYTEHGTCTLQMDDSCGWTPDTSLDECLAKIVAP